MADRGTARKRQPCLQWDPGSEGPAVPTVRIGSKGVRSPARHGGRSLRSVLRRRAVRSLGLAPRSARFNSSSTSATSCWALGWSAVHPADGGIHRLCLRGDARLAGRDPTLPRIPLSSIQMNRSGCPVSNAQPASFRASATKGCSGPSADGWPSGQPEPCGRLPPAVLRVPAVRQCPQAQRVHQREPGEPEAAPPKQVPRPIDEVDAGVRVGMGVLVASVGGMFEPWASATSKGRGEGQVPRASGRCSRPSGTSVPGSSPRTRGRRWWKPTRAAVGRATPG